MNTTTPVAPTAPATFQAPGKGGWLLDTTHFSRPVPPLHGEALVEEFPAGFAIGAAEHGLLLDRLRYAYVDGYLYFQPQAVGAPPGAGLPPKFVFRLLGLLHPALRARYRLAADTWQRRPWRAAADAWRDSIRPQLVAAALALQQERVDELDDAALLEHLGRVHEHFRLAVRTHGRLTVPATAPIGDLVLHVREWTGQDPAATLAQVFAPAGDGVARSQYLAAALEAIRSRSEELALLDSPAHAEDVLERLAELPAVEAWLDEVRLRIVDGYDLGQPTLGELPELLREQLRVGVQGRPAADGSALAQLRAQVPAEHRAEFDGLVDEALYVRDLRDERVLYGDAWAAGLLRRAVLEAGRRLAHDGRLRAEGHLLDARPAEIEALFAGSGPGAAELAERYARRVNRTAEDAPPFLGSLPGDPPPVSWLPARARRSHGVATAVVDAVFQDADRPHEVELLRGIGVSPGVVEATARLVQDASDFARLRRGDVLVARTTSPAYNALLPLLSGIVTDRGGALSHAAIVSREYGIPAVVGTREATARIVDGARVRVDGVRGEVTLLP